jgi:hypothetical protein
VGGRYSKHSQNLERLQELLELAPVGGPRTPRRTKQVHRRLRKAEIDKMVASYLAGSTV